MKRLFAGVLLAALLAFVGLQTAHAHASAGPEPACAVCAAGGQTHAAAPTDVAQPLQPARADRIPDLRRSVVLVDLVTAALTRGPPALS